MRKITKQEWFDTFRFKDDAQPDVDFDADLDYYDNGCVKDLEENFVIKCDEVERL